MPETRAQQFKKFLIIAILVLLVAIPIIAVTPIGPGLVRDYIDKHNPEGQPVKPWATEWMYKLGRFYSFSLRDQQAKDTYDELIFDWYDGDPGRQIPRDDPWVGMALFHYAKLLHDTGHTQQGKQYWQIFVAQWQNAPGVPQEMIQQAQIRSR